jgi:hypothetical protein
VFPSLIYAKQYSRNGMYGHLSDKQWSPAPCSKVGMLRKVSFPILK